MIINPQNLVIFCCFLHEIDTFDNFYTFIYGNIIIFIIIIPFSSWIENRINKAIFVLFLQDAQQT